MSLLSEYRTLYATDNMLSYFTYIENISSSGGVLLSFKNYVPQCFSFEPTVPIIPRAKLKKVCEK